MATSVPSISFSLLDVVIDDLLEAGINIMLLGDPGIGKSAWAKDLGNRHGMNTYVINAGDYADRQDVNGVRTICVDQQKQDYVQKFFPTYMIHEAISDANAHPNKKVLLFIDELTRATPDVTSTIMQMYSDHVIGNTKVPENVILITAGNDTGDITPLDTAKVSRFALYKILPDVQTFFSKNPDLFPAIKTVLTKHPSYLFTMQDIRTLSDKSDDDDDDMEYGDSDIDLSEDMNPFTTPRQITNLSNLLNVAQNNGHIQVWANTPLNNGTDDTLLDANIVGLVGTTPFYLELKMEILNTILNASTATAKTYLKPTSFDLCKAQTTKDDLTNLINTFDGATKCDLLIYALHDDEDNAVLIQELAKSCGKSDFTSDKVSALTDLIKDKGANNYNLDILRNIDSSESYASLIIDINNL